MSFIFPSAVGDILEDKNVPIQFGSIMEGELQRLWGTNYPVAWKGKSLRGFLRLQYL
jgi:hypothetical protein